MDNTSFTGHTNLKLENTIFGSKYISMKTFSILYSHVHVPVLEIQITFGASNDTKLVFTLENIIINQLIIFACLSHWINVW